MSAPAEFAKGPVAQLVHVLVMPFCGPMLSERYALLDSIARSDNVGSSDDLAAVRFFCAGVVGLLVESESRTGKCEVTTAESGLAVGHRMPSSPA